MSSTMVICSSRVIAAEVGQLPTADVRMRGGGRTRIRRKLRQFLNGYRIQPCCDQRLLTPEYRREIVGDRFLIITVLSVGALLHRAGR